MTDPNKTASQIDSIIHKAFERTSSVDSTGSGGSKPDFDRPAWLVREFEAAALRPIHGPKRIAGYVRCSTHSQSIDSAVRQEANIRTYCSFVFPDATIEFFRDLERSGAVTEVRPDLDRMMSRVGANDFDGMVVEEVDRLSTDLREGVQLWKAIEGNGVEFHSVLQKKRLDEGEFVSRIVGANDEVHKFKRRAQQAAEAMARRRGPTAAPFGYGRVSRRDKEAGSRDVVSDATVRLIHDLALHGIPACAIAEILNGDGVTVRSASTPTSSASPS